MALPTLNQLKGYLKRETTAEDTALTEMLAEATGMIRYLIDRPIEAVEKTYRIEGDTVRAYAVFTKLLIPDTPVSVASGQEPEVTGRDDVIVDPETYTVDPATGVIRARDGGSFAAFPYEVTAKVGLAVANDYLTVVEPMLRQAILAYAAMLYHQRNPNAASEATAGVTVSYLGVTMPLRTKEVVCALRRPL